MTDSRVRYRRHLKAACVAPNTYDSNSIMRRPSGIGVTSYFRQTPISWVN
jgi:hypothetical protein